MEDFQLTEFDVDVVDTDGSEYSLAVNCDFGATLAVRVPGRALIQVIAGGGESLA